MKPSVGTDRMYTHDGWANTDMFFSDPSPIIIAFGGRGIGKTYGVLKHLLEHGSSFVYMRRTQKNVEMCELDSMNPFAPLNRDLGTDIGLYKSGKYFWGFYRSQEGKNGKKNPTGNMIAPAVSLSTFCRGIDGTEYDYLVYDEFIPQKIDKRVRGEGDAFLNAVESLQRNRTLQGKPELKCILLSNTNSLDNDVLRAFGAIDKVDKMVRRGKTYARFDNALSIYLFKNSPISEGKKELALYKLANDEEFLGMALGNDFSASSYEHVQSMPIEQFRPLVSIGNITVYMHKAEDVFYVVPGVKSEVRYTMLKNDFAAFQRDYQFLKLAVYDRAVYYANAAVKVEFERIWEL